MTEHTMNNHQKCAKVGHITGAVATTGLAYIPKDVKKLTFLQEYCVGKDYCDIIVLGEFGVPTAYNGTTITNTNFRIVHSVAGTNLGKEQRVFTLLIASDLYGHGILSPCYTGSTGSTIVEGSVAFSSDYISPGVNIYFVHVPNGDSGVMKRDYYNFLPTNSLFVVLGDTNQKDHEHSLKTHFIHAGGTHDGEPRFTRSDSVKSIGPMDTDDNHTLAAGSNSNLKTPFDTVITNMTVRNTMLNAIPGYNDGPIIGTDLDDRPRVDAMKRLPNTCYITGTPYTISDHLGVMIQLNSARACSSSTVIHALTQLPGMSKVGVGKKIKSNVRDGTEASVTKSRQSVAIKKDKKKKAHGKIVASHNRTSRFRPY